MRGMDGLLGLHADRPLLGGDATPRSPRGEVLTPRSPRCGGRAVRRGAEECVAPTAQRGRHKSSGRPSAGSADWLQPALDAAQGKGGGGSVAWLAHAVGGVVMITHDGAALGGSVAVGTLLGEAAAAGSGRWSVCLATGEACEVAPASLQRAPPSKGQVARCVLGDSAGIQGEVLSVESGLAVLRPIVPAGVPGTADRHVRVLPVDALCRVDMAVSRDGGKVA